MSDLAPLDPPDGAVRAAGQITIDKGLVDYHVRALAYGEQEELYRLQEIAAAGIAPEDWDLFQPHPPEEVALFMEGEGAIFGLFVEDRLEGYSMLGVPRRKLASFVDLLPDPSAAVPPDERATVAHIDGVFVPTHLRGHGLQKVMIRVRMDHALALGCRHFLANASPRNSWSGHNMTRAGMVVKGVREMHGGKLRCLFHKDIGRPARFETKAETVVVPAMDAARQQTLIADGYWGFDLVAHEDGPVVLYAPAQRARR